MKRSPLTRRTGLARYRWVRKPRALTPDERLVRSLVLGSGRCEVRALAAIHAPADVGPCFGPLTPHHRRKASQGGAYSATNLVAVCAGHNDALEADADLAAWARSAGLVVRRGDPEWGDLGRG